MQTKKQPWIKPEVIDSNIESTKGKSYYSYETSTPNATAGPS